jgi:hypothetical protein
MNLSDFEAELREQTRSLLATNALSGDPSALRIAARIVRSGFVMLSWQERFLFLGRVSPLLQNRIVRSNMPTAQPEK